MKKEIIIKIIIIIIVATIIISVSGYIIYISIKNIPSSKYLSDFGYLNNATVPQGKGSIVTLIINPSKTAAENKDTASLYCKSSSSCDAFSIHNGNILFWKLSFDGGEKIWLVNKSTNSKDTIYVKKSLGITINYSQNK